MINPNWDRWIVASLSKFFESKKGSYAFYLDGQGKKEPVDCFELRLIGPSWLEVSRTKNLGTIIVNILIKCIKNSSDFHKIYRMSGLIQSGFGNCIPIKKYGDSDGDDSNTIIGYLELKRQGDKDIVVEDFGQVAIDIPLLQTTVEGLYQTTLTN